MAQPSTSVLLQRAIVQKCPVCGQGDVFASHFRMNRNCPACNVLFWKDPGESWGPLYLDYVVATTVFIVAWALLAWTTSLSDLPQFPIAPILAVAATLLCYPVSRSPWTVLA